MAETERTAAGLQIIIPGCERRTLPKSSSSANWFGQRLLGFYAEPSYGWDFGAGHTQSASLSVGLLFPIP